MRTSKKYIVWILVLVAVGLVGGLWIDAKGFWLNIFSDLVQIFIGLLIGLWILDRYNDDRQRKKWETVRHFTYVAIATHLFYILDQMVIDFADIIPNILSLQFRTHEHQPNQQTLDSIVALYNSLVQYQEKQETDLSSRVVEYYVNIKDDLNYIGDHLTPRVLEFSQNQKLIDDLIMFDDARSHLFDAVLAEQKISIGGIFPTLIVFVAKVHVLCEALG